MYRMTGETTAHSAFMRHDYLFRNLSDSALMGFIRIHVIPSGSPIAHIIELTSGRAFSQFSPGMQEFYTEQGYGGGGNIPSGFGLRILDEVLGDLQKNIPQ